MKNNLPAQVGDTSYLVNYADHAKQALQDLSAHRTVQRLRIIQAMTDNDLKQKFGEGSVVLQPGEIYIHKAETHPFLVVPIYLFSEFMTQSDVSSQAAFIQARSLDPQGMIAQKSRSPELREEMTPTGKVYHVESINVACIVLGNEQMEPAPVAMSFAKGDFGTGRNFASAMALQRIGGNAIPNWAQIWAISTKHRTKAQHSWWGYQYELASPEKHGCGPVIPPDWMEEYQELNEQLREDHHAQRIAVDQSPDVAVVQPSMQPPVQEQQGVQMPGQAPPVQPQYQQPPQQQYQQQQQAPPVQPQYQQPPTQAPHQAQPMQQQAQPMQSSPPDTPFS